MPPFTVIELLSRSSEESHNADPTSDLSDGGLPVGFVVTS